jgi:hypothetical protein
MIRFTARHHGFHCPFQSSVFVTWSRMKHCRIPALIISDAPFSALNDESFFST